VVAVLLVVVGPARLRPTTLLPPRSNGKPEAATAVDKLLMMGMRIPETCWAVFKTTGDRSERLMLLVGWFIWIFSLRDFRKSSNTKLREHPVGTELFRAVRQADMTKLIVAFRVFRTLLEICQIHGTICERLLNRVDKYIAWRMAMKSCTWLCIDIYPWSPSVRIYYKTLSGSQKL